MIISDTQINRTAVLKRFQGHLDTEKYIIDTEGQTEWVDNYIKFGDLIEEHMGRDACAFYFEQLYELLLAVESREGFSLDNDCENDVDKVTEEVSIITPKPTPKSKSNKHAKPTGKRLF